MHQRYTDRKNIGKSREFHHDAISQGKARCEGEITRIRFDNHISNLVILQTGAHLPRDTGTEKQDAECFRSPRRTPHFR